jgi:hypothetical protein
MLLKKTTNPPMPAEQSLACHKFVTRLLHDSTDSTVNGTGEANFSVDKRRDLLRSAKHHDVASFVTRSRVSF